MYGGTSEVERILGAYRGKLTIGISDEDTLGTSDIQKTMEQVDKYINARLSPYFDDLPIEPTPDALEFCSNYLTAYLVYTQLLSADTQEPPDNVNAWKEMALQALDSYIQSRLSTRAYPTYTKQDRLYVLKGVKGVGEGLIEDEDETIVR